MASKRIYLASRSPRRRELLKEIGVSFDLVLLREDARRCKRIRQLSIAALLAETMLRISNEDSVSSLFME